MPKKTRKRIFASAYATRAQCLIALTLAVIGMALSSWLVWFHLSLKRGAGAEGLCSIGGVFDCDAVNGSRFAAIGGVPIAYLAAVTYVILGGLAVTELWAPRVPRLIGYSRWLGTIAVAYSAYLALVSVTVLRATCGFCVGLYVVNLGFASLGWAGRSGQGGFASTILRDLRAVFAELGAWPAKFVFVASILGAIVVHEVATWTASQSAPVLAAVDLRSTHLRIQEGHDDGPTDESSVVVVEFIDFQCPRCEEAEEIVERVRAQYAGKIRFILKHFPIDRECNRRMRSAGHDRACEAAEAAICAGEQHRLWSFRRELFEKSLDEESLEDAARRASLDVAIWRRCRWSARAHDAVLADVEDALRMGVDSTPTFLVGDELIVGVVDLEKRLISEIDNEIERHSLGVRK